MPTPTITALSWSRLWNLYLTIDSWHTLKVTTSSAISDMGFDVTDLLGTFLRMPLTFRARPLRGHGEALAVSLDISKAFNRVWYDSLIGKLPAYGFPDDLCKWITNFLRDRSTRVVIDGCSSDQFGINARGPQGSVLSATFFLLHRNDLLKSGIFGYAGDSTVVKSNTDPVSKRILGRTFELVLDGGLRLE